MRTADLATTYHSKTDDELLLLAESEGLTHEARFVLQNELNRRGINIVAPNEAREPELTLLSKLPKPVLRGVHSVSESPQR